MRMVDDYHDLERPKKKEGLEVLVRSTRFVYRVMKGHWKFIRRQPKKALLFVLSVEPLVTGLLRFYLI